MAKTQKMRLLRARSLVANVCLALAPLSLSAQSTKSVYEQSILSIQHLIETGDLAGARAELTKASKLYPNDGGVENLSGVVEAQQGNNEGAERAFKRAILHSPKLTGAYLNLGRLYMQAGNIDKSAPAKALDVYERALQLAPANAEANYQASVLLMLSKNYQASLKHLEKLDATNRESSSALAVQCANFGGLGDKSEADRCTAELAAKPDLTEADAMEIAPTLVSAGRPDLAVRVLLATDLKTSLTPPALRTLGVAQEQAGNLDDARKSLERAFAGNSQSAALLVDLARVARESRDYQGALGYLAHARDMEPANAMLPYLFGLVSLDLSLLGESKKALEEAVRLEPSNPRYNFAMGIVSSYAQDATVALPYLKKYHQLRPDDPAGTLALGTTFFRAKDFDNASSWLKQASTQANTAASAHYYLGRIARQQGRLEEAASELRLAIALKPDQPDALAELGQVDIQMRRYPEAESELNQAIKNAPDNYAANFGLLQLYARTGDARREQQSKRFDDIQSKNQSQYQEMMRIIEIRPSESAGPVNP